MPLDPAQPPRTTSPQRPPWRPHILFPLVSAILYLGAAGTATFIALELDPALGLLGLLIVLTTAPLCAALLARTNAPVRTATITPIPRAASIDLDASAISESSRRVLQRHEDRDVLRSAIEEELAASDFDAALVLIDRLAAEHGLLQEAETYRARIDASRAPAREAEVQTAIVELDELLAQRRWDVAFADAARIHRLYPEQPRAQRLHERVEQARAAHKAELDRRFFLAAREDRVDEAMATLKELDEFLTEVEAEPYREVARGIISKARDTLGADFKLAVQDRRWTDADALGTRIIDEFPNTRMAAEVREIIDGVRERARAAPA